MAYLDVGIDLGTSNLLAGSQKQGLVVDEPSVVAMDTRTRQILGLGEKVYGMIGRERADMKVFYPLADGVISDFTLTLELIKYAFKKVGKSVFFKPRVITCIPCQVSGLEAQSMQDVMVESGARGVMLIQQPVASALGAGVDIFKPVGNLVVDIGAGTTDVAVLSMGGVVASSTTHYAGNAIDEAIEKHLRAEHNLIVGKHTAEQIKKEIASFSGSSPEASLEVKGRGSVTGLPTKILLQRSDLFPIFEEIMAGIVRAIQGTMERTPPELAGDIINSGMYVTGGGALLTGLKEMLEKAIRVPVVIPEEPQNCALLGTLECFKYWGQTFDGFYQPNVTKF